MRVVSAMEKDKQRKGMGGGMCEADEEKKCLRFIF